ncbi:hypothetical protein V1478_010315 [Vespula squamosa]|uniref:Uncharacterized protein n=1 Tax=Vespula squamosa TaxID=30214 RepID=A0ABD2AHE9_VESSQ
MYALLHLSFIASFHLTVPSSVKPKYFTLFFQGGLYAITITSGVGFNILTAVYSISRSGRGIVPYLMLLWIRIETPPSKELGFFVGSDLSNSRFFMEVGCSDFGFPTVA